MADSKKGHNLVNISRNSLKSKSGHVNSDPYLYATFQKPRSSASQDIVSTRFFYCYNGRVGNTYLPTLLAPFSTTPPPTSPLPPPSPAKIFFQILIIFRVVGFVLKKLLTVFEMLIVPHALQCIDGCFFVFYLI